jgi:hypothetical protein
LIPIKVHIMSVTDIISSNCNLFHNPFQRNTPVC